MLYARCLAAFSGRSPRRKAAAMSPGADARHVSPYSTREKVLRMLWSMTEPTLFRLSFHTWNGWRAWLLRRFGARIAPNCIIRRTVRVECPWNLAMERNACLGDRAHAYCLGPVSLGMRATVSQNVHLCAGSHDFSNPDMPLMRPPIVIGDDAWIGADSFVGPGVTIGSRCIVGARSVVVRDLPRDTVCVGHPAKPVRTR